MSRVTIAAVGNCHSVCVDSEGNVWTFGSNEEGQLGLGSDIIRSSVPQLVSSLSCISTISCGSFYTICVDSLGGCWAFGKNTSGELGLGNIRSQNTPQYIDGIPPIKLVACGKWHTMFLAEDSTIWACGIDGAQLGLGNIQRYVTTPQKVPNISNIIDIACGNNHTFIINQIGDVYGCGQEPAVLGLHLSGPVRTFTKQHRLKRVVRVSCGGDCSLFLNNNHVVYRLSSTESTPTKINGLPKIQQIICNSFYSYFVDEYGDLYQKRSVRRAPVTKIEFASDVQVVSRGGSHTIVKENSGAIYAFGSNQYGQLGIGRESFYQEKENIEYEILGHKPIRAKSARK